MGEHDMASHDRRNGNKIRFTPKSITRPLPSKGYLEIWDTVQLGLGLRINSGGRRSYFCMPRVNGVQEKVNLGTTTELDIAQAREKCRGVFRDAAQGIGKKARIRKYEREAIEKARSEANSFRAVAEAWLSDNGKGGAGKLRSKSEIQSRLEREVFPDWGDRPVHEISRADVRILVDAIAQTKPIAANRTLAAVRRMFNWAASKDRIDASPVLGVEPPADEKRRDRFLDDHEIARVWAGFEKLHYPFGPLFKILLLTGQRRNEVAGMKWSEINGDLWTLPGERTKNSQSNTVPLATLTIGTLDDVPRIDGLEHLFTTGRKGDRPVSGWGKIKERLDRIVAEDTANLVDEQLDMVKHALPHWTIHDLRRTVRTNLPRLGITPDTAERVLGHTIGGIRGVYDLYAYDREKRRALEAWATHIENLITRNSAQSNVVELPSSMEQI
jgi:integrase